MIKTPHLSVDGIIKLYDNNKNFKGIVLIERLNTPHGVAIPGGFVDIGESVENALVREMKEETNLDVKIESLLGVYSDPNRDPRFHTASIAYICSAVGTPKACDDAREVYIFSLDELPFDKMVFDHNKILEDFLEKNKNL